MEINLLHPLAFEKRDQLNWSRFQNKTIEFCTFSENIEKIQAPTPFKDIKKLTSHFNHIEKVTETLTQNPIPFFGSSHLNTLTKHELLRLEKGASLSLKEINQLCLLTEQYDQLIKNKNIQEILEEKFQNIESIHELVKLLKYIRRYVNKNSDIITENDEVLLEITEDISSKSKLIRKKLELIVSSPEFKDSLAHNGFDQIDDHFVITVKSDRYRTSMGDIISHSQTGASLYIEPHIISEISLHILYQKRAFKKRISQICFEISAKLFPHSHLLNQLYHFCLFLDHLQAVARVNLWYGFKRCEISNDSSIELIDFFHPFVVNPIRNHLLLDPISRGALISGPNTGGKTVCLKVIALCQTLMQFGYFVPAGSGKLPMRDGIYYLGNDDQQIDEGLSSFSSEIKNYLDLINEKKQNALIVIDEIFNSTSSEEASALSLGFTEKFLKNNQNHIFLSSHHTMLKNKVFESKLLQSFHMGFQKDTNKPTYKLIQGSPGSSMALEVFDTIASDYPYAQDIKSIASSHLDSLHSDYEKLITELSQHKTQITELKNNIEKEKVSYKNALKLEKDKEMTLLKDQINSIKSKLNRIKKAPSPHMVTNIKKEVSDLVHIIANEEGSPDKREYLNLERPKILKENHHYFSRSLGQNIEVIKIQNQKIRAQLGQLKITLDQDDLFELKNQNQNQKKKNVTISLDIHSEYKSDYDCRGMRLSEFEHFIENVLQGLLLRKIPYLRIIHGHGDGTLKQYLRQYLKKHAEFSFKPCENSSDGATIVEKDLSL